MASLSLACATAAPGSQRASRDICVARRAAAQPKVWLAEKATRHSSRRRGGAGVVRAAAGAGMGSDDASTHRPRRPEDNADNGAEQNRNQNQNQNQNQNHLPRSAPTNRGPSVDHDFNYLPPAPPTPTPRTPGDLHRRAAAAAHAIDAATLGNPPPPSPSSSSSSSSSSPLSLPNAASFLFPYPTSDAANAVSPLARGVCWSNLQDLDTVSDDAAVFILVFGAGTGSEGLYSLQERTREDVPVDIILAFPSHEDAARYGTLLEAEMGRVPVVEAARPRDLRFTCSEGGYRCKVARRGVLLMPPEKTVEVTDWERTNALRQGQWSVREDERDAAAAAAEGCQVMAAGGRGWSAARAVETSEPNTEETSADEVGEWQADFDEPSARDMLTRMFHRGDWNSPTS